MAVAETKVRISLIDAMTKNLQGIYGEMNKLDSAAARLKSSLGGAFTTGAGIAAGMLGFKSIGGAISNATAEAWNFAKSMETNRIGMAGILSSMTQLNGEALQWNDALAISSSLIDRLNTDALKTAATSEELVTTFRALLGPGLGAGMTIDEIQQLTTVGVNAVKSIGLDGRQLVQELRDMVQGGIQPASSTLATALGLKDSDIKAARNSAEGLFKFLMDRLQGFERASLETPNTLKGLEDQINEAITRTGSIGFEPLQNRYKEFLKGISDELLAPDSFELNPAVIANVREFSNEVVTVADDLGDIAEITGTVIVPAFKLGAEYLGVAADNTKLIAAGFAAWKGAQVASDLYSVATATNSAYQAQTLLGQAVQKVNSYYDSGRNAARVRYQDEMQAAQQAASVIMQAEAQKQTAIKQTEMVNKAFIRLAKQGDIEVAQALRTARQEYIQLGVSAQEAGRLQEQAAKQAARGNAELTRQILQAQSAHLKAAQAANAQATGAREATDKIGALATAATILTGTIASMTDETDGWINEAANMVFQVSLLITSVESLTRAFGALRIARLAALGGPIGLAVGAGYALYDQVENYNKNASHVTGFRINEHGNPEYTYDYNPSLVDYAAQENARRRKAAGTFPDFSKNVDDIIKGLETKNTTKDLAGVKSAAKAAEAEAKKLQQRYEKYRNQLLETEKDLETKITELTGSSFDIATAELAEEMQKVQSRITNAEVAGVKPEEINKVKELAAAYQELKEAQNIRDNITDMHTLRMDTWQAEYEAGLMYAEQLKALQEQELQSYMNRLQVELMNTQLNAEERLRLEQEYANAYTALQEAQAANADAIWDNALEHLKNTQLSQLETLNNGIDGMIGTLTNFGQNMLTEQKSFTERMKDLYSDLANSILNMMMKVIMQGLVMKTIMSAFGIGGGGNLFVSSPSFDFGGTSGLFIDPSGFNVSGASWAYAKGGYAQKGWALVGEEGPELLDLDTPGRIYTAEQTARTLRMANGGGSGSGIENIKVEIRNESGQPVQASSSSASFNGKDMIISVVLQAIQRNEQGSQDMIRAIAQKSG